MLVGGWDGQLHMGFWVTIGGLLVCLQAHSVGCGGLRGVSGLLEVMGHSPMLAVLLFWCYG